MAPCWPCFLKEGYVGERAKRFTIAAVLTILDAAVALRYGGMIWRMWPGILWSRILLLLLAALWAISLADLWARAYCQFRHSIRARTTTDSSRMAVALIEPRGDADV